MKSRVNALRLMWRSKFSALRRWQDFTRRSHVERFQDQLDEAQAQFEAMAAEKEEDIASLWELIGAQRVKENRVKLTLFLKKMKNSKLFLIWRGWSKFMNKRKKEAMDEEKDAMFNSMAGKMSGKKAEEIEAMLRTFLKRMQARKYVPAFNQWLELVGGRKKRGFEEQLELERQRRLAMMAAKAKRAEAQAALDAQTADIEAAKARLKELQAQLAEEKDGRREDKLETTRLTGDLDKLNEEK